MHWRLRSCRATTLLKIALVQVSRIEAERYCRSLDYLKRAKGPNWRCRDSWANDRWGILLRVCVGPLHSPLVPAARADQLGSATTQKRHFSATHGFLDPLQGLIAFCSCTCDILAHWALVRIVHHVYQISGKRWACVRRCVGCSLAAISIGLSAYESQSTETIDHGAKQESEDRGLGQRYIGRGCSLDVSVGSNPKLRRKNIWNNRSDIHSQYTHKVHMTHEACP